MANIGSLAVQLSLDAALFASGLDRSTKQGRDFASTITKTFAGIGAGVAGIEGIGGFGEGLYGGLKSGIGEMVGMGDEAKKLGVSLTAVAALQSLAGDKAESFSHAMFHMETELGKAAHGSELAVKPFADLRLEAGELAAMKPEQAFGRIADKLNALGNASDKAEHIKDIFGKGGLDSIGVIDRGLNGINETMNKIDAHGGVGFDMKGVEQAKQAEISIHELESTFNRLKLSLISEFTPTITKVADGIADMVGKAGGGKAAFKSLADGAKNFLIGLTEGMITIAESIGGIVDNIKTATDMLPGAKKLDDYIPPEDDYRGIQGLWKTLNDIRTGDIFKFREKGDFDSLNENKGVAAPFTNGLRDLLEKLRAPSPELPEGKTPGDQIAVDLTKINDFNDKLRASIATFGLGGEALERFKLAHSGYTDAMLKETDTLIAKMDGLKFIQESLSPLDKLDEQFAKLQKAFDAGGLTGLQYASALSKEFLSLSPFQAAEHAPGALQFGSDAAHSADVSWSRQGEGGSIQDQITASLQRMEEIEKQHLAVSKVIADLLPDLLQGRSID
jgi:hypothetical protein